MRMNVAGQTDAGQIRTNNEDALYVGEPVLIVADGMGGAAAGEVASSIAIKTLQEALENFSYSSDEEAERVLREAIKKADDGIRARVKQDPGFEGMGTTLVVAIHLGARLLIGYVGDSRAYIVTGHNQMSPANGASRPQVDATAQTGVMPQFNELQQDKSGDSIARITTDHSVVMEMVNSGVILEEDIRTHPMRNRITRCLGTAGRSEPDFVWHDITDGETLVMCSDGLWEMVHEDLILAIVNSSEIPGDMCSRLITAANNSGGVDNITVVAALFEA